MGFFPNLMDMVLYKGIGDETVLSPCRKGHGYRYKLKVPKQLVGSVIPTLIFVSNHLLEYFTPGLLHPV